MLDRLIYFKTSQETGSKMFTFLLLPDGSFELEMDPQKKEEETLKPAETIKSLAMKRMFTPWVKSNFVYQFFEDGKMYNQSIDKIHTIFDFFIEKKKKILEEERRAQKGTIIQVLIEYA